MDHFFSLGLSFKEILKLKFPHSDKAFFDTDAPGVTRKYCTPGTRTKILEDIETWANISTSNPFRGSGYWISGMAGTGKSTIAMSICKTLKDQGLLAGSFFCSRQITECRDYRLIIPTLVYQLAKFSDLFAGVLKDVLHGDFDLGTKAPSVQVENLLTKPWSKVVVEFKRLRGQQHIPVFIIDALDECNDVSLVLGPLVDAIQANRLHGLKFLFTSRPEQKIIEKMRGTVSFVQPVLQVEQFVLHSVEESSVQEDIFSYLKHELQNISPSSEDIKSLVHLSGKLFIYAATVVKVVQGGDVTPDERQK